MTGFKHYRSSVDSKLSVSPGKNVAQLQLRMGEVEVLLGQGKVRVAKLQERCDRWEFRGQLRVGMTVVVNWLIPNNKA